MTHWLEQVYREHRTQLFRCAWLIVHKQDLAEDAVHAAFVKILKCKEKPRNPKAYLIVAIRNAAIDVKREQSKHRAESYADQVNADCSHHEAEFEEQLASLTIEKREVIELRLKVGLTFVEIADVLEQSVSTITSRYKRAIEELKAKHGVFDGSN